MYSFELVIVVQFFFLRFVLFLLGAVQHVVAGVSATTFPTDQKQPDCMDNNYAGDFSSFLIENDKMIKAIDLGRLSEARWIALQNFHRIPECKSTIAYNYEQAVKRNLIGNEQQDDSDGATLHVEEYLQRVSDALYEVNNPQRRVIPKSYENDKNIHSYFCDDMNPTISSSSSGGELIAEEWDKCCSWLPQTTKSFQDKKSISSSNDFSAPFTDQITMNQKGSISHHEDECQQPCCDIYPFSKSHLKLPAIHEPALRLRIPVATSVATSSGSISSGEATSPASTTTTRVMVLDIEQDGYLRAFDVSGILWPAGYLLALCVANLDACGASEVKNTILQYQLRQLRRRRRRRRQQQVATSTTHVPSSTIEQHDVVREEETSGDDEGERGHEGQTISNFPPIAIELGAGIGIPSIVLSLALEQQQYYEHHSLLRNTHTTTTTNATRASDATNGMNRVVATDYASHAVALTVANAYWNHAPGVIGAFLNHTNMIALTELKERFFPITTTISTTKNDSDSDDGFPLVMGAALQGLFHTAQTDELFTIIDKLLMKNDNGGGGMAMLVHSVVAPLNEPSDGSFTLMRRISGDIFGMKTFAGQSSDFEISIFQRQQHQSLTKDKQQSREEL